MDAKDRFYEAAAMLPPFEGALRCVPSKTAETACEIRLRTGRPVIVESPNERYICRDRIAAAEDLRACIKHFCDYSLYSAEKELADGRITLRGGHRAGFAGTAVIKGGEITTIRDISSIDLRIAAEHKGIAEKLMSMTVFEQNLKGLILLGPPMSAKTTMLRDYTRLLSAFARTCVIDENGEIAAVYHGVPQNDIGLNCDVLDMFPKSEGIMRAVRLLAPEYVICDEVGTEYRELADCANRGVKLILSAHCGSMAEAAQNTAVRELINVGAVNYCALLAGGERLGDISGLWRVDRIEDISGCGRSNDLYRGRSRILVGA